VPNGEFYATPWATRARWSVSRSGLSQLSPLGGEEIEEFAQTNAEHDVGLPERALRHSLRKDHGL
jgi:hypothetical protein